MKKFILKCSLFFLLIFILDKSLFWVRNELPKFEKDKRLEQVLEGKINAQILIIGSSRGVGGIIAGDISKKIKKKCFNLSYLGTNIEFHEFILKTYLKTHKNKPEIIILSIDEISELVERQSIKFRYDVLHPLVKYPLVREELYQRGEKNKLVGELFFRHCLNHNIQNWNQSNPYSNAPALPCGTSPMTGKEANFDSSKYDKEEMHNPNLEVPNKLHSFKRFMEICRKNNIRLILSFVPNYWEPSRSFVSRMKELTKNEAECFFVPRPEKYTNDDLYYNSGHLNFEGAKIYTQDIIEYLQAKK